MQHVKLVQPEGPFHVTALWRCQPEPVAMWQPESTQNNDLDGSDFDHDVF
jgi:hypothetical protein